MSGPKCSQYELDQRLAQQLAEAEEAKRQEAERQRLEELRMIREWTEKIRVETQTLEAMNSTLVAAREEFPGEYLPPQLSLPPIPTSMTSTSLQLHFNLLIGFAGQAQAVIRAIQLAAANSGMQKLIATTSAHIADDAKTLVTWLAEVKATKAGFSHKVMDARKATAARLMKELAESDRKVEVKRALEAYLLAIQPSRVEMLEMELRIAIQHARIHAHTHRLHQAEAELLLLQLPTLDLPDIPLLREDLQRAACGITPLEAPLRARVAAVKQAAETNMAESCAGDIAATVLKNLGFTVSEGFSTLFVEGGEVFVQRPGANEYHIAFQVDKEDRQLTLRAVRDGLADSPITPLMAQRDTKEEEKFCIDFPRIVNALSTAGIKTKLISAGKPGLVDVEVVDLSAAGRVKRRERSSKKYKTRTVGKL